MPKVTLSPKEIKLIKTAGVLLDKKIRFLKSQKIIVTQMQIAEAIGKRQPTISMMLRGDASQGVNIRNWSYRELMALFTVLQFSKDEIRQFIKQTEIDFPEI